MTFFDMRNAVIFAMITSKIKQIFFQQTLILPKNGFLRNFGNVGLFLWTFYCRVAWWRLITLRVFEQKLIWTTILDRILILGFCRFSYENGQIKVQNFGCVELQFCRNVNNYILYQNLGFNLPILIWESAKSKFG